MRRIKLTSHQFCFCLDLILLLALANPTPVTMAQPINPCPKITLECVFNNCNGPEYEFRVGVSGTRPSDKLTYNWSTSAGSIISGQGTPSIKVDTKGTDGQGITVTVEIDGLESGCEKAASFTISPACGLLPPTRLFDRFGEVSLAEEKERLDNFALALQQEPGAEGYIIVYNGQLKRAERARKYLINERGIISDRLVILEGGNRKNPKEESIDLWVRPVGARAPEPDPPARKNP